MRDQQDTSVEGQILPSPAERRGPSPRHGSGRPAVSGYLTVQGGENVTLALFTPQTVNTLNVLLRDLPYGECVMLSIMRTLQVCVIGLTANNTLSL